MSEPITLEDLSAYLDDALTAERRAAVTAALAADGELRAALEALAWTDAVVRAAPLPELPPGRSLGLPDSARNASPRQAANARTAWWGSASGLAALAAALAVAAGLAAAMAAGAPILPADPVPPSASASASPGDPSHATRVAAPWPSARPAAEQTVEAVGSASAIALGTPAAATPARGGDPDPLRGRGRAGAGARALAAAMAVALSALALWVARTAWSRRDR